MEQGKKLRMYGLILRDSSGEFNWNAYTDEQFREKMRDARKRGLPVVKVIEVESADPAALDTALKDYFRERKP